MRARGGMLALALAWLALGASVSEADVSASALAPLPYAAHKLTAYDGYVVFSQLLHTTGTWALMVWHGGSVSPLPVPPRHIPFDANAGPGVGGAPVVVYSHCVREPSPTSPAPGPQGTPPTPEWETSVGCRIYELALPAGKPRPVPGLGAPGSSDSTPAIWRGDIAFARTTGRSRNVSIHLWHHASGRLSRLGGGPSRCPVAGAFGTCSGVGPIRAWVAGMSLGRLGLAYEWAWSQRVAPLGTYEELRVDPLRDGRESAPAQIASTSLVGGACNGWQSTAPNVLGAALLYVGVGEGCEGPEELTSRFVLYSDRSRTTRAAGLSRGLIAAVAQDRGTTYWIKDVLASEQPPCAHAAVCANAAFSESATCAPRLATCTLMRTTDLLQTLEPRRQARSGALPSGP